MLPNTTHPNLTKNNFFYFNIDKLNFVITFGKTKTQLKGGYFFPDTE